jgi:hypothetical protein
VRTFCCNELRHQGAAFCDIGADVGIEGTAFAGVAAVLEGVAVAERRAAAAALVRATQRRRDEDAL